MRRDETRWDEVRRGEARRGGRGEAGRGPWRRFNRAAGFALRPDRPTSLPPPTSSGRGSMLLVLFASFPRRPRPSLARHNLAIRVIFVKLNRNRYRSLKIAIAFARRRYSFGSSSSPRLHYA